MKKMNSKFFKVTAFILIFTLNFLLVNPPEVKAVDVGFHVDATSLTYGGEETSGKFNVTTEDNWYVRSNSSFITLVGGNRNGSRSTTINFTMPQNTTGSARTGEIFIVSLSRGTQYSINVTQKKYDTTSILNVISIPTTCSYEKSEISVSFTSKYSWNVSITVPNTDDPNASNVTTAYASPSSGYGLTSTQTTKITVPKNYGRNSRNITITLKNQNGITITKTVVQQGAPKSVPNLYGFRPSDTATSTSTSNYTYLQSYIVDTPYTITSVEFDASENWTIPYATNGLVVNRTSGGSGHNVVYIKMPAYKTPNEYDLMILSGSQTVSIKMWYALVIPSDHSYVPLLPGGKWEDFLKDDYTTPTK